MREALNLHHMGLVNTHKFEGSGSTFYGPNSATRVDYIAIPKSKLTDVAQIAIWRRAGHTPQLAHTYKNLDHAPLVMDLWHESWFEAEAEQSRQWNRDKLMTAWLRGGAPSCVSYAVFLRDWWRRFAWTRGCARRWGRWMRRGTR